MVFRPPNPLADAGPHVDEVVVHASLPRSRVKNDNVVDGMAPEAMIEVAENEDNGGEDGDLDSDEDTDEEKPVPFHKDSRGSSDRPIFVTLYIMLFLALGGLAFATARYIQAKSANRQQAITMNVEEDDVNEVLANRDSTAYKLQLQSVLSEVIKSSTLLTPSSPQAQAVEWMVFQDATLTMNDILEAAESGDPYRVYQRYALMALFFATNGELWEAVPWTENGEIHECDFVGVDCDESEQVVILDLFLRKLRGRIPDDLGLLTQLTSLTLNSNLLEGSIPALLFESLTNLEFLDLARNYFSSSLSPDIAKLTNLKILVLDELSGLTGSLPNSLIRLTNLRDLRLRQTQMTAPIFDFIEYWPELENLDIGQSWVTGSIPTNIAVSNNKLKRLHMIDAKINATDIPTELGLLTEMTHFELWSALADGGTIPTEFGTCENLKVLHIEGTAIVGPIPTEMGYLTNLDRLVLQTQGLTGSVPSEIGLLTSLEWLKIARNKLIGTLPSELSNLKDLATFDVSNNGFTGAVPSGVCNDFIVIDWSCGISECDCCRKPCKFNGENNY